MGIQEPPGALQCLLWTASCPGLWARCLWAWLREGGRGPGLGVSWVERLCAEGDQVLGDRAWVHGRSGKVRSPAPLPAAGSTSVRPRVQRDGHAGPVLWPGRWEGLWLQASSPCFIASLVGSPWGAPRLPGSLHGTPIVPRAGTGLWTCSLLSKFTLTGLALGRKGARAPGRSHSRVGAVMESQEGTASPLSSQVGWSWQTLGMWPRPQGQSLTGCPGDQKGGLGPERGCQGPGAQPVVHGGTDDAAT